MNSGKADPAPPIGEGPSFPGEWGDLAAALAQADGLLRRAVTAGLPQDQAQAVRRRLAAALVLARRDPHRATGQVSEIIDDLARRVSRA